LHTDVPQAQLRPLLPTQQAQGQQPEGAEPLAPTTDLNEGLPKLPPVVPGGMPGQTPYGPGYEGMGPGYGASPYGGADPYGGYGGTTPYGMGPGYGSEGGMPGGYNPYGGGTPGQPRQPPVKFKLVRFFDFTAEIGKTYRYRVSVVLEDPNRPIDPRTDPNKRILESSVIARLAKVEADDQQYQQRTGKEKRTYYRQTEWSDPSEPVTVPKPDFFVAGAATAAKMIPLSLNGPLVQMSDPQAKLVPVVWDRRRAVETPAERDVSRGSYLNFEQDADVLHPAILAIKRLEKYSFQTNAYVADLRGGEECLKDVDKEARTETLYPTPGEVLVVDGLGNLVVCNEIDNCEEYRRVLFIEDSPVVATPTGPTGSEGMEGAYPGSPYFGPGAFPGGGP
jgi:hypothetical protein